MTGSAAVGSRRDRVLATVCVGAGRRADALGTHDRQAPAALFEDLAQDRTLRAVVSSCGRASFNSGSDTREWLSAAPEETDASVAAMESAPTAIEGLPVPVVASLRGTAPGTGCPLACACDLRVVTEDARLGMPVPCWSSLVPPACAARLSPLTGLATARDLLFSSSPDG
ncbi:enoyl-CoA hydratase/isomerase family protein [Streptomyces sp. NPDC050508]|uniref:enoyl-CoA hydratase/isomerase family protein n=1 Tax=Streptomyces sp. NPDC050508 TaxID=3155405 RepID=UPI00341F0784